MLIDTIALYFTLLPFPIVTGAIRPLVAALTLLQSPLKLPLVDVAIAPLLGAETLWLVCIPASFVVPSSLPRIASYAFGFVVNPVSLV